MEVWLAGSYKNLWEILGIFSTEERAIAACKLPIDFVAPLTIDEVAPDEPVEFLNSFYPLADFKIETRIE